MRVQVVLAKEKSQEQRVELERIEINNEREIVEGNGKVKRKIVVVCGRGDGVASHQPPASAPQATTAAVRSISRYH